MKNNGTSVFHYKLKGLTDTYVQKIYNAAKKFPKEEIFGTASQYKSAALSVALNYVEGYARQRAAVLKNFLEIAHGSLKES